MARFDSISLLDAMYSLEANDAWVRNVADALGPWSPKSVATSAIAVLSRPNEPPRADGCIVAGGEALSEPGTFRALIEKTPPAFLQRVLLAPISFVSEVVGTEGFDICGRLGRIVGIPYRDGLGCGVEHETSRVMLGVSFSEQGYISPPQRRFLRDVRSHLNCATQLRDAAWRQGDSPAAVFEPHGKSLHHSSETRKRGAREALKAAILAREQARGALRRRDNESAFELWPGLVEGRWGLVDKFDTDGRRFVLAVELPDRRTRGLTSREGSAIELLSEGLTNKAVASELGISTSTAGVLIARALRKLRLRRTEVVALRRMAGISFQFGALQLTAQTKSLDLRRAEALSPALQRVLVLVSQGLSNRAIARRRRVSTSTIENQLRTLYAEYGVHTREELVAVATRRPFAQAPQEYDRRIGEAPSPRSTSGPRAAGPQTPAVAGRR